MSYPPPPGPTNPNDPYGQQQPGYGYPQAQPQQPPQQQSYGYPQGQPQQVPPQQPAYGQGYQQQVPPQQPMPGYPQQSYAGAPGVAQADSGYVQIPGLGTVEVANMGARLGARLLDGVFLGIVYGIVMALGMGAAIGAVNSNPDDPNAAAGSAFLILLLSYGFLIGLLGLYEWICIGVWGQTLGKKIVGIRVVRQNTGQAPGLGASFMRSLAFYICGFVPLLNILMYLSPLFDSSGRKQGWQDKMANTLVIRGNPVAP
ncbi:hypothetical protein BIV57_15065 [Mangrovactinospora gilvigrisea]|uniref:RDD domain-containing protein n=1 Tax=Mangrovactinospora gilvigrisea TaxID=1428644 RepID=A0A1J7C557_9ACTN|nr:RDD family protein [Mangrovactinospora gilvigrisea]OIV36684.1 hypothetical protein BIV57_15065 [Mangrovactinospora gilvigrisea]